MQRADVSSIAAEVGLPVRLPVQGVPVTPV
jgi:hypothetical protein